MRLIWAEFHEYPTYIDDGGFRFICLNPWKFTAYAIAKFKTNPANLVGSLTYQLGKISDKKVSASHRMRTADPYPYQPDDCLLLRRTPHSIAPAAIRLP